MDELMLGTVMVVSGPSGCGKSTIFRELRGLVPEMCFSVSCTTRKPRPGELDGEHYYFLERGDFERRIAANEFIEYAEVFGNFYGTLYSEVEHRVREGRIVFLDIDVQGAMQIKKRAGEDVFLRDCLEMIFVSPPDRKVLEARLRGRGTETEDVIQRRLAESDREIACWKEYDYLVVNGELSKAVDEFHAIIRSFSCSTRRRGGIDFYYE